MIVSRPKTLQKLCSVWCAGASNKSGGSNVATIRFYDRADEFRIELVGRFAGDAVRDVRQSWEDALREKGPRRFSLDISRLSGYDASGRKLLAEMYRHGMDFAARTPSSLVFLDEVAKTPRTPAALIATPMPKSQKRSAEQPFRAMAAGE